MGLSRQTTWHDSDYDCDVKWNKDVILSHVEQKCVPEIKRKVPLIFHVETIFHWRKKEVLGYGTKVVGMLRGRGCFHVYVVRITMSMSLVTLFSFGNVIIGRHIHF
jgi:hypothetical protein